MAASGFTPISLYYSTTASAVPTAGNLANGELALNIADMKLYAKNSSGTVTLLASNASTTGVDSLSFGSTGLTPSTATTGAITVAGTLNVANGGTGVTTSTGSGSVVLSNSPTLVTPALGTPSSGTVTNLTGTASININGTVGATTPTTGAFTTISLSGDITQSSTTGRITYSNATTSGNGGLQNNTGGSYVLLYPSTHATKSNHTDIAGTNINFVVGGNIATVTSVGLGIGTTSPGAKFNVTGSGNIVRFGDGTNTFDIRFQGPNNWAQQLNTSTDTFSLQRNSVSLWSFSSSGALGIGSSPSYGTSGQVLTSAGSGSAPTWSTPAGGGTTMLFAAFSSTMGL